MNPGNLSNIGARRALTQEWKKIAKTLRNRAAELRHKANADRELAAYEAKAQIEEPMVDLIAHRYKLAMEQNKRAHHDGVWRPNQPRAPLPEIPESAMPIKGSAAFLMLKTWYPK